MQCNKWLGVFWVGNWNANISPGTASLLQHITIIKSWRCNHKIMKHPSAGLEIKISTCVHPHSFIQWWLLCKLHKIETETWININTVKERLNGHGTPVQMTQQKYTHLCQEIKPVVTVECVLDIYKRVLNMPSYDWNAFQFHTEGNIAKFPIKYDSLLLNLWLSSSRSVNQCVDQPIPNTPLTVWLPREFWSLFPKINSY